MTYHFAVHKDKSGYWAECIELKGCHTQAESKNELVEACEEALNLFLDEPSDSTIEFPLPDEKEGNKAGVLEIAVEPEIALAMLLKHYRKNRKLTQRQVSEMLGMKNLYSYQRLERRSNPTLKTIKNIHSIFPEMKIEKIFQ